MKRMHGFRLAVALYVAAINLVLMGRAEQTMAAGLQDTGWQEKQASEVGIFQPDSQTSEGQEAAQRKVLLDAGEGQEAAQRKVLLEVVAADAQVVKGKPYSADTTTETVQVLADGNHIVHRTVSKIYRDTDGRTRREQTFGNVAPDHPSPHEVKVFIDDPVNGTAFVLDPGSKSADEVHRTRKVLDGLNGEDDGTRIMFKSVKDSEDTQEGGPVRMMVKFRDEHSGDPLAAVIPDEKREIVKEDLGSRNIEGVDCTGTRQTITIPTGEIGNEKPISIVRETWFAPVISAVVESTSDDPRYGKTTYQLKNVQLNEPSRSMFEPPADFKVNVRK